MAQNRKQVGVQPDEIMAEVYRLLETRDSKTMTAGEFRDLTVQAMRGMGIAASEDDVELQWDPEAAQPLRLFIKTQRVYPLYIRDARESQKLWPHPLASV